MANIYSVDLERDLDDHIKITDIAQTGLDITGDMTQEMWIKLETLPTSGQTFGLIGKYGIGPSTRAYHWFLYNYAGTIRLETEFVNSGGSETVAFVNWTPDTNWHHIAFTYTASAGEVRFYVDGSQQGTTQGSQVTDINNCTSDFYIGRSNYDGHYFDGLIDEVRVWNIVRTQTQINDNKDVLINTFDGLVGSWHFEEGSGSTCADSSGNGNTLTYSGDGSLVFSTDVPFDPSPSVSPSASESPSVSPSSSESPSVSPSASVSPSSSESPSVSPSSSESPSVSPSASVSPSSSESPSPSPGYTDYTRGDYAVLPINNADLEHIYTPEEITKVALYDGITTDQTATGEYAIHQFKNFVDGGTEAVLTWKGQTNQSAIFGTIYLQVYNHNTDLWETVDSNSVVDADTDFTLIGDIDDLTDYKDGSDVVSCRVWQLAA